MDVQGHGFKEARVQRLADLLAELDRLFRDGFKRSNGVPCDLTLAQYEVVTMVRGSDMQGRKCSQKTIAENLNVTGPTVVRIIDALEKKGLVMRTRDEVDRRVVLVSLTAKGGQAQHDCTTMHEHRLNLVMERLPATTTDVILGHLSELVTAARHV